MKADLLCPAAPEDVAALAVRAERRQLDGFFIPETNHDALLSLALAASSTSTIEIGTSIAVAFARTPMTMAVSAYDLQRLSNGRLILGLGSQIRPHITNRYSMPWSRPAARMKEFVAALRAIWSSWQHGTKLDFRGDFYTHTLMTPMFDPGPLETGNPRVLIAAVGPQMTQVAADIADGMICHPLSSPAYVRHRVLPALTAGRADREMPPGFEVTGMVLVATGRSEEEVHTAISGVRRQLAFYASTPAYRPVLDYHGWGELQGELNELSKQGRWHTMTQLINDDVLNTFAVVGEPRHIGPMVRSRFTGLLDRVSLAMPYDAQADLALDVLQGIAVPGFTEARHGGDTPKGSAVRDRI